MHRYLRAGRALALAGLILGGAASLPVAIAPPAFASHTYTWSLTCGGEGGCSASWNWTQNGVVIANPSSGSVAYDWSLACSLPSCSISSSSSSFQFVQPDTANGLTATLAVCVSASGSTQCNTQPSTLSFAPGGSVSLSLPATIKAKFGKDCFPGYPCGGNSQLSETATLNINS